MTARLEHANLVVRDIDATIRFLQTAFPEFRVRHDSGREDPDRWVHIGTQRTYIALTEATKVPSKAHVPYAGEPGMNHLGFEVDDVAALSTRMSAAGYEDSTVTNDHPWRKRVYFYDPDGNDWEFVQYLSDNPAERNDYAPPDRR